MPDDHPSREHFVVESRGVKKPALGLFGMTDDTGDGGLQAQWGLICERMRPEIGEPAYQSWLKPITVREMLDGVAVVRIEHDLDRAIDGADVVMALRIQKERMAGGMLPDLREYARRWGITESRLARADRRALLMHPGPMNQGIEISPEVAYGEKSVIAEQVTNGVAVRMAILYLLLAGASS